MNAQQPKSKHHSYTTIKRIGNGNFGQVYLVRSALDDQHYVIKKIKLENRSKESKQQIIKQIKVMQQLNHYYVIKYVESFVQNKCVCIVMEHAEGGDLDKFLEKRKQENKPLSEQQIIEWLIQLLLGLKYVHEKKVVHRDLKPDNIFLTSDQELKLGDFGISKLMSQTFDMAKTKIGTPFVMAPQIWENMKYNQKSDVWSLGCVIYKMMTFRYPFQADNSGALVVKILTQKIPVIHQHYSHQLKALVYQMLSKQPQKRPSVHKILEMPFLKKNFSKTLQKTINLYDQNYSSQEGLKKSASINKLFRKKSTSSLSTSLAGKSMGSQESLKIIEYKQNYPFLVEANEKMSRQLEDLKQQKQKFQEATNQLLSKLRHCPPSSQQILLQFQQHIQRFLYP